MSSNGPSAPITPSAEVLEHLPPETLRAVCDELCRVAAGPLLIGVPYKQDLRVGRSTCRACGATNPPWDHRSAFDRDRVERLFPTMTVREVSYVGRTFERTNPLSTWLMDLAGNPYGAFGPRSTCLACGAPLSRRPPRSFLQKVYTKLAVWANRAQRPFIAARPGWIHVLFLRRPRNHPVDIGF